MIGQPDVRRHGDAVRVAQRQVVGQRDRDCRGREGQRQHHGETEPTCAHPEILLSGGRASRHPRVRPSAQRTLEWAPHGTDVRDRTDLEETVR